MKNQKSIISTILILFIIFSVAGSAAAVDPITLTVTFDKKTVKVGDEVQLTIVQKNNGIYANFTNIKLLITVESDGKVIDKSSYALYPVGDSGNNVFNATTGIWQSKNLKRNSSGGGMKTLIIYFKVPADLEGKTISAKAHYNSIQPDPEISNMTFSKPGDVSDTLTVQKSSTETGTTNTTKTNTNITDKKTTLAKAINATKSENGLEALQKLDNPSDHGKSYEVSNATGQNTSPPYNTVYAVLGILGVAALIGFGYFKGLRN